MTMRAIRANLQIAKFVRADANVLVRKKLGPSFAARVDVNDNACRHRVNRFVAVILARSPPAKHAKVRERKNYFCVL